MGRRADGGVCHLRAEEDALQLFVIINRVSVCMRSNWTLTARGELKHAVCYEI